jgi:hypothetical protein
MTLRNDPCGEEEDKGVNFPVDFVLLIHNEVDNSSNDPFHPYRCVDAAREALAVAPTVVVMPRSNDATYLPTPG